MRAIDLAINVDMSRLGQPEWLKDADRTFQRGESWYEDLQPEELVPEMDRLGVEKAVLGIDPLDPSPHVMGFAAKHPGRFYLAAGLDPRRGTHALAALQDFVCSHEGLVVEVRVTPFMHDLAPNTPLYYPIYAKCIELGLPIGIYTGIPVPPMPSECQNPIHLDRVCLDFPELVVIMAHGADPWWDVAIRLMLKYKNLYLQTSAWAPKRLPVELIAFMNTRGSNKILWASNHPTLQLERCFAEFSELDLRPNILDRFLYTNAARVLFGSEAG
jgi:predicted TIM-barrel fold metal-dependent hydrolase